MLTCEYKNTFLFLTDKSNEPLSRHFNNFLAGTRDLGDGLYIISSEGRCALPAAITANKHYIFNYDTLAALDYVAIPEDVIPGNNHFMDKQ